VESTDVTGVQQESEALRTEQIQGLTEGLHLLVRTLASHGKDHPLARQSASSLQGRVEACEPPFSVQFVGKALFCDGGLVPLNVRAYRQARFIGGLLEGLKTHELSFDRVPEPEVLTQFGQALVAFSKEGTDGLAGLALEGLSWRELPDAAHGVVVEEVDPEVFTAAQLAVAVGDAEELVARRTELWKWSLGTSVVRRLERAQQVSGEATTRALEVVPGAWSRARRAVGATLHCLATLHSLHVSLPSARAAAHATLALACMGLDGRQGIPFRACVGRAFKLLIDAPALARSGVEPHRAKVCALLHLVRQKDEPEKRTAGVLPLVRLAYELERARCPEGLGFDLTLADLLAQAVAGEIEAAEPVWVNALVCAYGCVPPGARVKLTDGRIGLVLESGEDDPLRPAKVLVGGESVVPHGPVQLVPPSQVSPVES